MRIAELIERLGRSVFEAPFGASADFGDETPEIAEVRIALLDEIKKKIQRAGGKALFPYNIVRVVIRADDAETAVFDREFFRKFFEEEVRKGLTRVACRFPTDLRIEIRATESDAGGKGKWLRVETVAVDKPPAEEPRAKRTARLVVVSGTANKTEIPLQKTRINIGRLIDVYKEQGLSRRNDLAFAEDSPINRTVSREHAHILHDKKTGEYRLFNDRWYKLGNKAESNCGLWIVRDGMGQEVHRDTRGTRLLPGDEIHLGKAVLKFQLK
jgi:hypothetical protein